MFDKHSAVRSGWCCSDSFQTWTCCSNFIARECLRQCFHGLLYEYLLIKVLLCCCSINVYAFIFYINNII